MNLAIPSRRPSSLLLTLGLAVFAALCATGLIVLPTIIAKTRLVYGGIAAILFVIAAVVSGNIRLFCLWSLMLTLPFDLNKHFGPEYNKMGGESAFKAEMSDPFILALFLYLARDVLTRKRPGIRVPKVTFLWIAIILMGVAPILWGPYRTTAAHEVFRMVKMLFLFLIICNELNGRERIMHCAAALSLSMIVQSIVGLAEKFRGGLLGLAILGETSKATIDQLAVESVVGETVYRTAAFLRHPNLFGMFLAVLIPVAIAGFLLPGGKLRRAIFLLGICLGPPALITTLSRSSWVSAAAAAGVFAVILLLHDGLRPRVVVPAALAFVALVVIGAVYSGSIWRRLFESRAGATIARDELKADAWALIEQEPIWGWGMNSYALNVPHVMKIAPRTSHKMWGKLFPVVHNTYLLWWSELGIVGLSFHLAIWAWMILIAIRNLRLRDELLFVINAACLGGLIAFIPDGFFSFSVRMGAILRLYWVIAGITMAVHYLRLREGAIRRPATPAEAPRELVPVGQE